MKRPRIANHRWLRLPFSLLGETTDTCLQSFSPTSVSLLLFPAGKQCDEEEEVDVLESLQDSTCLGSLLGPLLVWQQGGQRQRLTSWPPLSAFAAAGKRRPH